MAQRQSPVDPEVAGVGHYKGTHHTRYVFRIPASLMEGRTRANDPNRSAAAWGVRMLNRTTWHLEPKKHGSLPLITLREQGYWLLEVSESSNKGWPANPFFGLTPADITAVDGGFMIALRCSPAEAAVTPRGTAAASAPTTQEVAKANVMAAAASAADPVWQDIRPRSAMPVAAVETIRQALHMTMRDFAISLGLGASTYAGMVQRGSVPPLVALGAEALQRRHDEQHGRSHASTFLVTVPPAGPWRVTKLTDARRMSLDGSDFYLIPTGAA